MSSTEPNADDMSVHHPHDLLIAKFFPDEDLPSVGYDSMEYDKLYVWARDCEAAGTTPLRIPWPLPPLRPRDSRQAGVEQWRSRALRAIDSRIALFTTGSIPQRTVMTQALRAPTSRSHSPPTHRLFLIPELLELILRQATPQVQHTAWNVSRLWRSTVEHILAYQYRSHNPCPPVEHGEPIDLDTGYSWMQPSDAELAIVEQQALTLSQKRRGDLIQLFYPANITEAESLSTDAYLLIQTFYERAKFKPVELSPIDRTRRWLDLSQVRMNPHIVELFGSQMKLKLGRCEIALKGGAGQPRLLPGPLHGGNFARLIADMFLTEPACKALGIYTNRPYSAHLEFLDKVCDEDGIRVGQFLGILRQHADKVLSRWKANAEFFRQKMQEPPWIEFSTAQQKRNQWVHHGSPTFVVSFERTCEGPTPLARHIYTAGEDFLSVRMKEWFFNMVDE